jgi:hypothetical protein
MDLGRDEDQENIIEDSIFDRDGDATLLFLNNSGEGDDQNRRNGSDEGEGTGEGEGAGEEEGAGSDEGEADSSGGTLNITKFGEVYVY